MNATCNFLPHKKGTTLLPQKFRIEDENGPVDLTSVLIKMQFKTSKNGVVEHEFTNQPGGGIVNTGIGAFETVKQIIDFQAFDYVYAIQLNYPNGDIDEPVEGIFPVYQDIVSP